MDTPGSASAIGRLGPGAPWVGFEADAAGWHLVFGQASARQRLPADARGAERDLLLDGAIAYFAEVLEDAPGDLEATHQEVAALVHWLLETEPDPIRRRRLRLALDAVEDGLAADEVIGQLMAARNPATNEPADAVDRLVRCYRSLGG